MAIIACHVRTPLKSMIQYFPMYGNFIKNVTWSYLGVDFFFMIAGFFMFLKIDYTQSFVEFAKKKLIRFMPLIVFMLFLYLIFSVCPAIFFARYEFIFTLLNIQNIGLTKSGGMIGFGQSWFLSSLFWSMCFYFYLYKILNDKRWFNLIIACTIFFCYSFLVHSSIAEHNKNEAFVFNIGCMRALAGLGVGYFLSMIYKNNIEKIIQVSLNIWQKLLITALEIYIFAFTFYYLCLHKISYNNQIIMLLSFIVLLGLFIARKGYFSKLLDNKFSVFLGQFTFSIFLTHCFIVQLWAYYVCQQHKEWVIANPVLNIVLVYFVIIFFGAFIYYFVDKPMNKYLKKKFL